MEPVQIIQIATKHIRDLIEIEIECGLSRWSHTDYLDELARPDSIMLAASVPEKGCAGFLVGRVVPGNTDDEKDAEIYNIGVRLTMQGRGVGSRLMRQFFSLCGTHSVDTVWLDVRRSNEKALSFYRSFGFGETAVRKGFYRDPDEDGVVMSLVLDEYFSLQERNIA